MSPKTGIFAISAFAIVLLAPGINGVLSGTSIKELWLQMTIYCSPGLKFFVPLTFKLQPVTKKKKRIHIFEIIRNMPVRFGSLMSPIIHINRATGTIVIIKIMRAHTAKILAKKFFKFLNI